jgi:lysophospholipase L1-like esterase
MKLNAKELSQITFGALRVTDEDSLITFDRFTELQKKFYQETKKGFYKRALHTAGIVIDFKTDSEKLSFSYKASFRVTRSWYYFDVYENDMMILHHGEDLGDRTEGEGKIDITLSRGMKRVRIYLPYSQRIQLTDFELDDGAAVISIQRPLKALILGDSVTQGFDAKYPSLHYVSLMTERYSMSYINQAIGSETFNAGILGSEKVTEPDVITLAMGSNDWATKAFDEIERDADKYFSTLTNIYEDVPIIYISPIWLKHEGNGTTLPTAIEMLESVASSYGAHVIHGLDLVPHDEGMFSDGVHPTDLGFSEYSKRLFQQTDRIIEIIKKAKEEKEIGLTVL